MAGRLAQPADRQVRVGRLSGVAVQPLRAPGHSRGDDRPAHLACWHRARAVRRPASAPRATGRAQCTLTRDPPGAGRRGQRTPRPAAAHRSGARLARPRGSAQPRRAWPLLLPAPPLPPARLAPGSTVAWPEGRAGPGLARRQDQAWGMAAPVSLACASTVLPMRSRRTPWQRGSRVPGSRTGCCQPS